MTPSENFLSSVSIFVGSTEALSKVFLLFFLFSDWLKSNHLNSQIEHGFLNIFYAIFDAPYRNDKSDKLRNKYFGTKKFSKNQVWSCEMIFDPRNQQFSVSYVSISDKVMTVKYVRIIPGTYF